MKNVHPSRKPLFPAQSIVFEAVSARKERSCGWLGCRVRNVVWPHPDLGIGTGKSVGAKTSTRTQARGG